MKPYTPDKFSQSVFNYLCPRHQAWIAADHASALFLWRDAMAKGKTAYRAGGIRRSRLLFGTAFETVVVRMRQNRSVGMGLSSAETDLNVVQLADAGKLLSQVLCDLREFEEAERVLSLVHSSLLLGVDKPRPQQMPLNEYLHLVEDFVSRLAGVMTRLGKAEGARVRALLTWSVIENQRAGLVH